MATTVFKGLTLKELLELERISNGDGVHVDITDKAVENTLVGCGLATVESRGEHAAYMQVTTSGETLLVEAREED